MAARLAAQYPGVPLYAAMATPDRPFPIIMGSIMRVNTPQVFYAFEVGCMRHACTVGGC